MIDTQTMREIVATVFTEYGMKRYLNGDPIELHPTDLQNIIRLAWTRKPAAQVVGAAMSRYEELTEDCELEPVEALRFFCSLAMNARDWLDAESFFDAITAHPAPEPVSVPDDVAKDATRYRWLRRADNEVCVMLPDPPDDMHVPHTEALDEAIDRALAADRERT